MNRERFASIAIPIPVRRLFTYRVDPGDTDRIAAGSRVRVPFGRRTVVGTVVEWPGRGPEDDIEIRSVSAVLDREPLLDPSLLELTRFVSEYYLCSWGEAIEAALPPEAGPAVTRKHVRRVPGATADRVPARAVAQRRALDALPADGTFVPLGKLDSGARRAVGALESVGLVEVRDHPIKPPEPVEASREAEAPPTPTREQSAVLDRLVPAIERDGYDPFLLFGATGSGKTEVYLRAAEAALHRNRGVLYLVPEIGLTPLLVSRVRSRFPGEVAVLHSGLAARERRAEWEAIREGRRRFVVGARSAVFAPLPSPGLVIVDEEQDSSYKQEETPRYNGRDLAVVRAHRAGAVLVLGSATPSLESFYHARTGRYTLLRLGGRVHSRPLPRVRVVDMRREYEESGEVRPLSRLLVHALARRLERGEQALVLRNRRGWATALYCPACGERVTCSRCSIAMTWHRAARRLCCHYCELERGFPAGCPRCGREEIRLIGEGTERIEDDLREALPRARIARMDRDTVRRRGAHEALLRRFDRGEIDVLVGTQMIAKGHDFPRVTLVGVLSADQSLGLPDFRAAERTFQLLTQVAGRAGRHHAPGEVVVQAFDPAHPVLREAAAQDYERFYEREIPYRRALRYPPLSAMVRVLVTDADEGRASGWAERLGRALREGRESGLIVSGPGPAPVEKIRGRYRQQILVRSAGRRRLVRCVERAVDAVDGEVPRRALTVDVDPLSLL